MNRQQKKRSKRRRRQKKDEKQTTKKDDNDNDNDLFREVNDLFREVNLDEKQTTKEDDNDNDLLREENLDLIYYGVRSKTEIRRNHRYQSEETKIENHIPNNHPAGNCSLPCDIIIYDILTRVPIESLLRFRSVCKEWTDLIWDPSFIDLYSRRSNNPPGLIYNPPWYSTRLTFFDINKKKKNKIFFPQKKNDFLHKKDYEDEVEMLYSLNGLLLLYCFDVKARVPEYCVYNPVTGLSAIIPDPKVNKREFRFSIAYDSITSKYKVVCFGKYDDEHRNENYVCKIFTLGRVEDDAYSWRDVVVPKLPPQSENYYLTLDYTDKPVFANGYLHWMMERNYVDRYYVETVECDGIFRFDVSSETFNTIRFPKYKEGERAYLHEIGGLLCFVDQITYTKFKLWVLKEVDEDLDMNDNTHSKKKHEWTNKCGIDMGHLEEDDPNFNHGHLFAILAHPTQSVKLIFRISPNDNESDGTGYFPYDYYSYDTKLKQFYLICNQHDEYYRRHCLWHVNSLSYL